MKVENVLGFCVVVVVFFFCENVGLEFLDVFFLNPLVCFLKFLIIFENLDIIIEYNVTYDTEQLTHC